MPRITELWRNYPLFRLVLEELLKTPKGLSEKELLEILKKEHGIDVSRPELRETLMRLELRGFTTVDRIGRDLVAKVSPYINKVIS